MATEIILGQLRLTVASLTIEQINQDRERFLDAIRKNIDIELDKIGLCLINVNVTDITDESGYIESIGKKAALTAINQAKVDVAEQDKLGAIGEADARKEQQVKVAEFAKEQRIQTAGYNAKAVEGENTSRAEIAVSNATLSEREAEAIKNIKIDKITVWDSPNGGDSSTANFMRNLVKTLPPLHDIAQQAGLDLPGFLGTLETKKEAGEEERA